MDATSAAIRCEMKRSSWASTRVSLPCTSEETLDQFSVVRQGHGRGLWPVRPHLDLQPSKAMVESFGYNVSDLKRQRLPGNVCDASSTTESVDTTYASSAVLQAYMEWNSASSLYPSNEAGGPASCTRFHLTSCHDPNDCSSTGKHNFQQSEPSACSNRTGPYTSFNGQLCFRQAFACHPARPANGQIAELSCVGRPLLQSQLNQHCQAKQNPLLGRVFPQQRELSQQRLGLPEVELRLKLHAQSAVLPNSDFQDQAHDDIHGAGGENAGDGLEVSSGRRLGASTGCRLTSGFSLPAPQPHLPRAQPQACVLVSTAAPAESCQSAAAVAAAPARPRPRSQSFSQPLTFFAPTTPPLDADAPRECILLLCKVLCMSESTTARLALHIWYRIRGMVRLLVSLRPHVRQSAVASAANVRSAERLYPVAALWLAAKLEERRREVPSVQTLAAAARTLPSVMVAAELRVLQWCEWAPYMGFVPDESHLLFE